MQGGAKMKKWISILFISAIVTAMTVGCNDTNPVGPATSTSVVGVEEKNSIYNTAFETFTEGDASELGLIINNPKESELAVVKDLETYEQTSTEESLLIIPKYKESKITVSTVADGEEIVKADKAVYTKEKTTEGYGLLIKAMRPEGTPSLIVALEYKDKSIDYIISANGETGNAHTEYLIVGKEMPTEDVVEEDVIVIKEENYTEGLNLVNQYEVDINNDGEVESIEVYSAAEMTDEGELLLDDGQEWTLILRKGEVIYPLFERSYVQLGTIDYKTYIDYDDNEAFHVLVNYTTSAGLKTYDYTYNKEKDTFTRKLAFNADNISMINQWR